MKLRLLLMTAGILLCFESTFANHTEPPDFKAAKWIGDGKQQPVPDSLMYLDDPAPVFRKEFVADEAIRSAMLYITAAGYYSASVNGVLLDKNYLDPAWTDFRKRIYYTTYEVGGRLNKGRNCISVALGNGFYNSLPMAFWGRYNLRDALTTGRPMFIARLVITYVSGKTKEIVTDDGWKCKDGPVMRNNVYLGEVYDARKEMKGCDKAGFNDREWKPAVIRDGPGGVLQKAFFPSVQAIDLKQPLKITEVLKDTYVVDMGENFAGAFKVCMQGKPGDTVRFKFGERIYPDNTLNPMTAVAGQIKQAGLGGAGAPAIAEQAGMYIFGQDTVVSYAPVFSFRVYRYMEISGLRRAPVAGDIMGIALSSNVGRKNRFSTDDTLINSIQKMITRTFLSNLMSVQSDCPGREKFGYGGDLQATDEAFICNFDMRAFYRKVLYDWVDGYQDSVFIDAAPYVGLKYCGLNFEAAIFDVQQNLYEYYGDTAIVRELYDFDLKWMDKAARIHPSGIVDKGLSDHESLVNVPVQLLGTASYLNTAKIMRSFSVLMNNKKNEMRFSALEEKIRNRLKEMYWSKNMSFEQIERQSRDASIAYINSLPRKEKEEALASLQKTRDVFNKQTFYAILLYHDIIPASEQKGAVDSLLKALDDASAGHFTTGIFGTKYLLEVLSRYGHADRVFKVVNSTAFPGWGFMVKNGATTQWETWKESDNIYSNCYPMFGSVSAWFYRWLAGIKPTKPGFKEFSIAPLLPHGLSSLNCTYDSPNGAIVSNWTKQGNMYAFRITIPQGSVAGFQLPELNGAAHLKVRKIGRNKVYLAKNDNRGAYNLRLNPGRYLITLE